MSGIQSLLKYRFAKKEAEKISSTSSTHSVPSTSNNSDGTMFTKRGATVILSDSEDDDSPIKVHPSPVKSSPWLSKDKGMIQNGFMNNSPGSSQGSTFGSLQSSQYGGSTQTLLSSQASSLTSSQSVEERGRERNAHIASLQGMFPNSDRSVILEALEETNEFDEAVDHMIRINKGGAVKRKFSRIRAISTDSESSPMKKKPRPLIDSQSSQETIIIGDDVQHGDTDGNTGSAAAGSIAPMQNGSSPRTFNEKIAFLRGAFPKIRNDILEMTLRNEKFDVDAATIALTLIPPECEPCPTKPPAGVPVSPPAAVSTISIGSIKDFRAARQMNKLAGQVHKDYEEDGENFTPAKGIGAKVKIKHTPNMEDDEDDIYIDDSDSDDDFIRPADPVLEFFNTATVDECASMQGCSRKKAGIIVDLRPYDDWDHLVYKIENAKDLTFQLISACKEVLRIRNVVNNLMKNCKRIASEMGNIVADITSKTTLEEGDVDKGYLDKQPSNLNTEMQLKPYQMVGLNWLMIMHDQGLNGILGDEMGLGKTIQTIAFLAQLLENGDKGPHVIIAPSSTLDNWLRELHLWCPDLKVMLYYGSQEERREVRAMIADGTHEEFHVVMTTYNMATGSNEDRALYKKLKFNYAVFDEGHMLKNMSSARYQSLMKIKAARRLLLTGTPLQNNLVELMSLLAFVMPDIFVEKSDQIKRIFTSITSKDTTKGSYEKHVLLNAKNILKPFFLRRLKSEVLKQLPSKVDLIEKVSLSFEQQELYDSLKMKFSKEVREQTNQDGGKQRAGSAMMMELRKAANHPLLHRRNYDDTQLRQMAKLMLREPTHTNANVDYIFEDMQVMSDFELHKLSLEFKSIRKFALDNDMIVDSGKFRHLDELLAKVKSEGARVLLFSQFTMMMDIMDVYLKVRQHKFIRLDGSTPVSERQQLIDRFNNDKDIFIFTLSTKAGGLGINLTSANTVILHDIDFNPYNDKQAEDRCHRVGQTKDVTVYRLVSRNTIEEAMLRCAQAKLRLEQDVTGTGQEGEEEEDDVASLLKEALAI